MTTNRGRVALVGVSLLVVGCTGGSTGSARRAEESTAPVLVPEEARFRDSWRMEVKDSPDNYSFRSNWSASFDPEVDPELTVLGYQVSDPTTFSGGDLTGTGQAERDAVRSAVTDGAEPGDAGPCQQVAADPVIARCSYDIGGTLGPFSVLVRLFDTPPAAVVVLYPNDAALEYLSGDFEAVDTEVAVERWHNTRW